MEYEPFVVPGRRGRMVDPQRDARRLLAAAEARGLRVRCVLDTHVRKG